MKKKIFAVVTCTSALGGAYFGHTFEVCDIHHQGRVSLKIEGRTTDFSFREVLICNLQAIAQEAYDLSWVSSSYPWPFMPSAQTPTVLRTALYKYAAIRGIKLEVTDNAAL